MHTGEPWRLGHRPALDGLRGLAVVLVVADHAGFLYESAGSVGVTMFFVLSGFLITRLIVEARDAGEWSLRRFYWNRAVRLVPSLYVMVAVVTVASLLMGWSALSTVHALPPLLYVQNYMPPGGLFQHTWSLAVEEQFYLLWPLVLPLLMRARRPLAWIGAAALCSMAMALTAVDNAALPLQSYGLLAGCGLALVVSRLPEAPRWVPVVGALGILLALGVGTMVDSDALVHRMISVPFAVLLLWRSPVMLATRVPRFFGRISYALYLWHLPLLALAAENRGGVSALPIVVLSVVVASASTILMEEPIRRRFRAASRLPRTTAAPAESARWTAASTL